MRTIVPHLWFDRNGAEAAGLYTSLFPDSSIKSRTTLSDTPSGNVEMLSIELSGQDFAFLSAGPEFRFTPAISLYVACEGAAEVDRLWRSLGEGGSELMPLGAYPFAERYAWVIDRFGLSWQLSSRAGTSPRQKITPTLMFTGEVGGKAEEALSFYVSVFREGRAGDIFRYGPGAEPNLPDMVKHADFSLAGQDFAAMDSALDHGFAFNEAISFMVYCDDQAEIDHFWGKLSARPEAEQCGWLKDRYGLSWQILPRAMDEMMRSGSPEQLARVTAAFLPMKKFDLAALERAFRGS